MIVTSHDHVTRISGYVADQTALHGMLAKVRDFGLVLISVKTDGGQQEPAWQVAEKVENQPQRRRVSEKANQH